MNAVNTSITTGPQIGQWWSTPDGHITCVNWHTQSRDVYILLQRRTKSDAAPPIVTAFMKHITFTTRYRACMHGPNRVLLVKAINLTVDEVINYNKNIGEFIWFEKE
jgi:hypothetical protein